MTRNYSEEDSVKKGLASLAVALGASEGDVAQIDADGNVTLAPGNGGSQPFVVATLRHSADFRNLDGSVPVIDATVTTNHGTTVIALPPTAVGNNSLIQVNVFNDTAADVLVGGSVVVQSADGTVWIEQDTSADQTIAAGATATIDFASNGGSAGAGLSWNAGTKQVDIANAGVFSAFANVYATPA